MDQENQNRIVNDNTIDVPGTQSGHGDAAGAPPSGKGKDTLRRNLLRNLRSGVRMALLRRVAADGFRVAAGDLAFLAVTDLVLNLIVSFLLVGADGEFNYSAFPSFFFHLPLMLLCGLLAGRLLGRSNLSRCCRWRSFP